MLAFLIVNVVVCRRSLRGVRLERWIDEPLLAHSPTSVHVSAENASGARPRESESRITGRPIAAPGT